MRLNIFDVLGTILVKRNLLTLIIFVMEWSRKIVEFNIIMVEIVGKFWIWQIKIIGNIVLWIKK
jgi:hypothetical protein